jgi:hypothetical protein
MRNIFLALAFLAPAGQEPAPPANRPCDLSSVEEGFWCPKCGKLKEKEQLAGAACKDCGTAPEAVKVCVKKWIPRCGMHEQRPHLESCCKSKFCCKFETVKHPILWACRTCGREARSPAGIAHEGKEHDPAAVQKCGGSGVPPHGGPAVK